MKKVLMISLGLLITGLLVFVACAAPTKTTTPPPTTAPASAPTTKPAAPSNLTASKTAAGEVVLTWTDNSNNEDGFRIDRSTDSTFKQGSVVLLAWGPFTSYTDKSAAANTTYYYRVVAYNAAANSNPSSTVTVSK